MQQTGASQLCRREIEGDAQTSEQPSHRDADAAAGVGDATARMIAEAMRSALKPCRDLENKTGTRGRLGMQAVNDAPADGRVLLFTPIAPISVFEHVYEKLGYGPAGNFAPLSQVATFDFD